MCCNSELAIFLYSRALPVFPIILLKHIFLSRNRSCSYQLAPHKAYNPKQGEWLVERDRNRGRRHSGGGYPIRSSSEPPEEPLYRRTYTVPTSTTRYFFPFSRRSLTTIQS